MAIGLLDRINATTTLPEFAAALGRYGIHKIDLLINPQDHHAYMVIMRGVDSITIGTGITLHAAIDDAVSRAMHLAGAAVSTAQPPSPAKHAVAIEARPPEGLDESRD